MKKKETIRDLLPKVDDFHRALSPEARRYLNDRGISDTVIDKRKLGQGSYNGHVKIMIPITDQSGTVREIVLRQMPDEKSEKYRYLLPKDSKAMLLGTDQFSSTTDTILVVEGVLDALAGESLGVCTISSTAGVNTFPDEWFSLLPINSASRLINCFDMDDEGRKGAERHLLQTARLRPDLQLYVIELPYGKDLTEFLQQSPGALEGKRAALLALAKHYQPRTQRDFLIDTLAAETSLTVLAPCQGMLQNEGYICVSLRHEGKPAPFIVTSSRDCFPCTSAEWTRRGIKTDREPVIDGICRWDQRLLVKFLKHEEGEVLSLADAIYYVRELLIKYVDFADERCFFVVAVWIVMTYMYRLFPAIPYLHFTGLKGAGKTKIMLIISLLAFSGELVTSSSSPASILRLVHNNGATLGVDEAESLWKTSDENSMALQDVLRSGYKIGIQVTKCEKAADGKQVVIRLDPFSPKALSGIRGLEDALSSRCIEILMLKTMNRKVANSEIIPSSSEWADLRALLYPAAIQAMPAINTAVASYPLEELTGRNAELWKPLLLIADIAKAKDIHQALLSYALEHVAKKKDDESEAEISQLLLCLHGLLADEKDGFVTAEDIFDQIGKEDEFSWVTDLKNRSRRGHWLNARLKRLGLWDGPAELRSIHGEKKRGYALKPERLVKTMERFGIPLPPSKSVPSVPDTLLTSA